jgi:hypothetical protein
MILDYPAALYEACRQISPIKQDYANLPIEEGFDWSSSLGDIPFDRLYLVVFRSVRRPTADLRLLKEHDDRAYEAAREAGGLLRYFRGEMNEHRECLSFCLWASRRWLPPPEPPTVPPRRWRRRCTSRTSSNGTSWREERTGISP